jgi:adenine phosphoribosyltransferase
VDLKERIRNIRDWPKPGIVFRDITTLLTDPIAYNYTLDRFCEHFRESDVDKVLGIEARGFIFGGGLASRFGVGFVPARKPSKLPFHTLREEYALEYGTDALEIHTDSLRAGEKVLVVDDLLATGGTLSAAVRLVERAGAHVAGIGVVVDLAFLKGRERLARYNLFSLVQYDSE